MRLTKLGGAALLAAAIVAGCLGSSATSPPTQAPSPTAARLSAGASQPAVTPTLTPPATPSTLSSAFYRYRITFPSPEWLPTAAQERWDGSAVIEAPGPYVDLAYGPASSEFVAYGAPTTLGLEAWAALGQQHVAEWHGCPATAEKTADVTIDGVPARLHAFHCGGLWDQKVFVVHVGFGLVLSDLAQPGTEAADTAAFLRLLQGVTLTS